MLVLTFINKIKVFGERWEEAAMRKLAILIGAAVLGLGLGLGAGDVSADDDDDDDGYTLKAQ